MLLRLPPDFAAISGDGLSSSFARLLSETLSWNQFVREWGWQYARITEEKLGNALDDTLIKQIERTFAEKSGG